MTRARLSPPLWAVVVFAAACYWRIGYAYGIGDHEEILPQLLRALDPSLFTRDPYLLAEDAAFSVRFVFLGALRVLSLGVGPEAAVFAVSVAAWAAVCWAAFRLAATLVPSRSAAALAVLASLATVHWTPGGNALVSRTLVPESIAWAPCLLAVEAFVRGRTVRAAVLLGLAAWLQPLMGLQVGLLLGLVSLWQMADGDARGALRRALAFGATFALVAAPVLLPTLLTQAGTAPPADGLATFYVTAYLRQAHHYLLFSQDPAALVKFGLVVAAGLGGLRVLRDRRPGTEHLRTAGRMMIVIAALCALYVVGTEGLESLTVAKMQFFRLTLVAKLVLLAWASGAVVALVPRAWRDRARGALGRPAVGWSLAAAVLAATVGGAVADVGRPGAMWYPRAYRQSDVAPVEAWIAARTPRDAVFLVPPGTTTFRSHALRGAAINFKPTTFRDDAMHRWLARLRTVAPAPLPPRTHGRAAVYRWREALDPAYHAHTPREWARLGDAFDADYALVDRRATATPPDGEPVYADGAWAVYPLR